MTAAHEPVPVPAAGSGLSPAEGAAEPYDFILAGGGVSGLALAHALLGSRLGAGRILVIDRSPKDADDRTLSYFAAAPTPFDGLAQRAFQVLRYFGAGAARDLPLATYRYLTVRGLDFYRFTRDALSGSGSVTLVRGHIDGIEDGDGAAAVIVDGVRVAGRWVFDSRPEAAELDLARHDALLQRFVGWEIEAEAPLFDAEAATLFDFASAADDGGDAGVARFYYVIPFTPRRALIELVALGGEAREEDLARLVERTARGARYRIVRREGGASLLTGAPFARRLGRRVLAIGVAGGRLKPSTGYAFTRILDDAARIVRSLEAAGHPFARARRGLPYRFFDAVFLRLLAAQPARVEPALTALFTRNPVERVLRFLDERASVADVLALVASLPKLPFLRALAGWVGTRLGLVPPARQLRP